MFDQSYNNKTLVAMMRKGDFRKVAKSNYDSFRHDAVTRAKNSAATIFGGVNPISVFHLKKKSAYRIKSLADDLVVRKLSSNIKRLSPGRTRGRSFVVSNLKKFLDEGVPYRVYRLDVKSFYESFSLADIRTRIDALRWLTPLSKKHLFALLKSFNDLGGKGVPRGMAISAVLSEWMMADFDAKIRNHPAVYFYGRYVDDITIITNLTESEVGFIKEIGAKLPTGLVLNENKMSFHSCMEKFAAAKGGISASAPRFSFSYLGYEFNVFDRAVLKGFGKDPFRHVQVEIAPEKVKKIKMRIVRSFLDYMRTHNFPLLLERIRFLTSNYSIGDKNTGKRQLSGIYFSYPLISPKSKSLLELDAFLRKAVLSKKGRIFSKTSAALKTREKKALLGQSFVHGHRTKHFVYFSPAKIGQLQKCWLYE
jgi:hypothetical protein